MFSCDFWQLLLDEGNAGGRRCGQCCAVPVSDFPEAKSLGLAAAMDPA
jgi:hypothetical protein